MQYTSFSAGLIAPPLIEVHSMVKLLLFYVSFFFWGAGFVLFQIASGVDVVVVGADVCVESGSGIDDANRCE